MRRTCAVIAMAGLVILAGSASAAETRVGPKGQFYVDGKPTVPFGVWPTRSPSRAANTIPTATASP